MKYSLIIILLAMLTACGGSSPSGRADQPATGQEEAGGNNGGNSTEGGGSAGDSGGLTFGAPVASNIRPGVFLSADGSGCTSNFLFYLNDQTIYLGTAAHCFSPDTNSGLDSCETRNLEIGAPVTIENASQPGTVAYSSWRAMQEVGETPGSAACLYNDFALVKVHPDDITNIHPAVRAFGGPTGRVTGLAAVGDTVYAYGRSPDHFGLEPLERRSGQIIGVYGDGWLYDMSNGLLEAGIPGDSGGPVLDASGRALAVTSILTVSVSPVPVSNGVVNLSRALNYAKDNGFINKGVTLMTWNEFSQSGGL